eukprot:COSAG02_NODE_9619_length_2159_cov_1.753883_3_plen_335_part_00
MVGAGSLVGRQVRQVRQVRPAKLHHNTHKHMAVTVLKTLATQRQAARACKLKALSMLAARRGQRTYATPQTFSDLLHLYGERTFRKVFRMSLGTFRGITTTLVERGGLGYKTSARGRKKRHAPEVAVAAALRFLFGASYAESVLLLRCKSVTTVYRNLEVVCRAVVKAYALPNPFSTVQLDRTASTFATKRGAHHFPSIAGAIDGLLLRVIAPARDAKKFFSRKGYHAMNMIAVADGEARITYYSCQCSGSTHDALAMWVSSLQQALDAGWLPRTFAMLGDDAFSGNSDQVLCPYSGAVQPQTASDTYNFYQSSLRMAVERCFGIFVGRFGLFW